MSAHDGASMPRTIDDTPRCEGCFGYHGSVGGELTCLRAKLRETRDARDLLLTAAAARVSL